MSDAPPPSATASFAARLGLFLGPLLAIGVYLLLPQSPDLLSAEARLTAAVGTLMACWWMTEAIPLPATALLPLVLFPLLGIMPFPDTAAPYASKFIFLFMGGFLIALAMERWNLHRRIALTIVSSVGAQPARLIGGFMLATAALSMWISNTATTVMMLPMAVSVADLLSRRWRDTIVDQADDQQSASRELADAIVNIDNFSASLLLGIAYAASIGGVATIVGTPPNTLMAGFLADNEIHIDFASWMLFATPLSIVFLLIAWLVLTKWLYPVKISEIPGGQELIASELRKLGSLSRGEWSVLIVFICTALAWISRSWLTKWTWFIDQVPWFSRLDDTMIALVAALLLFMIPVDWRRGVAALDWQTARRMPYEILLLFGGGLSLAAAVDQTGLADWICRGVASLPIGNVILIIVVVTAVVVFLTELTSNLATASVFLPLLFAAAKNVQIGETMGIDPLLLIIPASLAASCAFMLPVATPPNAVVYGSGKIQIGQMIRAGWCLNLIALILIPLLVYWLAPLVFGVKMQ